MLSKYTNLIFRPFFARRIKINTTNTNEFIKIDYSHRMQTLLFVDIQFHCIQNITLSRTHFIAVRFPSSSPRIFSVSKYSRETFKQNSGICKYNKNINNNTNIRNDTRFVARPKLNNFVHLYVLFRLSAVIFYSLPFNAPCSRCTTIIEQCSFFSSKLYRRINISPRTRISRIYLCVHRRRAPLYTRVCIIYDIIITYTLKVYCFFVVINFFNTYV